MWIKSIFLFRDLLCQYPGTLISRSYLDMVPGCLVSDNINTSSGYPTSRECLFLIIVSNIASTVSSFDSTIYSGLSLHQQQSSGSGSGNSNARTSLRSYLDSSNHLSMIGDICERMYRFAIDSQAKDDAISLLLPIVALYSLESGSVLSMSPGSGSDSFHPLHEKLISVRSIYLLVEFLVGAVQYSHINFQIVSHFIDGVPNDIRSEATNSNKSHSITIRCASTIIMLMKLDIETCI